MAAKVFGPSPCASALMANAPCQPAVLSRKVVREVFGQLGAYPADIPQRACPYRIVRPDAERCPAALCPSWNAPWKVASRYSATARRPGRVGVGVADAGRSHVPDRRVSEWPDHFGQVRR